MLHLLILYWNYDVFYYVTYKKISGFGEGNGLLDCVFTLGGKKINNPGIVFVITDHSLYRGLIRFVNWSKYSFVYLVSLDG